MSGKDPRKWRAMICRNRECKFSGLDRKHWHEFNGEEHKFTCANCGSVITVKHHNAVKRMAATQLGREKNRLTSILPRESFF